MIGTVRTPAADFGEIKPSYWSRAWRTRRTPCTIWWGCADAAPELLLRNQDRDVLARAQPPRRTLPAEYGEHLASFAIDGTLLAGSLPRAQLRLVRQWAARHEVELLANWERLRSLVPLVPIEPLS